MDRREFMSGLAAATAASWPDLDYDPSTIDDWEPMSSDRVYIVETIETEARSKFDVDIPMGGIASELGEHDVTVQVTYDVDGINVELGAESEDRRFSGMVELDAETAREIAVMLFQGAWEWDVRESVGR